jgi:hypothetical protein
MMVSQENGATVGTTTAYYPVDQFQIGFSTTGALNSAQVSSRTPAGSPNRARITVTTADASPGASELVYITQYIEGLRIADLAFGTASAKTFILRFGVRAPAGTYCISCRNGGATRSYVAEFTIASGEANTDVVKSVTIPGDVTGTWAADNTLGLAVFILLMCGTSYQGTPNSWQSSGSLADANQFNFMGTNGNVFELFDVGLYQGSAAPAFQVPDYATELLACKRYCYLSNPPARGLVATATTLSRMGCNHPVAMRAAPTVSIKATINVTDGAAATTVTSITNNYSTVDGIEYDANLAGSLTAGRIGIAFQTATPGTLVNARM